MFLGSEHFATASSRESPVGLLGSPHVDSGKYEQRTLQVLVAVLADSLNQRVERNAARAKQLPRVRVAYGRQQAPNLFLLGVTDSCGPVFAQPPGEQRSSRCVPGRHVDIS